MNHMTKKNRVAAISKVLYIAAACSLLMDFSCKETNKAADSWIVSQKFFCSAIGECPPPAQSPTVYGTGSIVNSSGERIPGYWENFAWHGLPFDNYDGGYALSITRSNSDIYISGMLYIKTLEENLPYLHFSPGYWKNGIWTSLVPLEGSINSWIRSFIVSGTDVYAAGYCRDVSGDLIPGYWLNGVWTTLPYDNHHEGEVAGIAIAGSDVYFAGYCFNVSGELITAIPGYWLNGTWNYLPLNGNVEGYVSSIVISGPDIYISGICVASDGARKPGYWKNSIWNQLPYDGYSGAEVQSIIINGTDIFVTGTCLTSVNGSNSTFATTPGFWLNGSWNVLPTKNGLGGGAHPAFIYQTDVYIGGDNSGELGFWKNNIWVPLQGNTSNGGSSYDNTVTSLIVIP